MFEGRIAQNIHRLIGVACLWGSADFLAQIYESHKEAAERRARGEAAPTHSRPTMSQMYELLDKPRLGQTSSYALIAYPFVELYKSFLRWQHIVLTRHFGNCALALMLQQAVVTPILMCGYFAYMTAWRGGFNHPEWLLCIPDIDHTSNSNMSVMRCIWSEAKGYPLITSWASFTPIYALAYFAPFRGYRLLSYLICLPWLCILSHVQRESII